MEDSMVKFVKSENLSDENYIADIRKNHGCTTEDIKYYVKPIIRRKPDIILVHNTISKVKKMVKAVQERDGNNQIKLGYSSIIIRKYRDLEKEIKETNTKLKNYCLGKGFIFVDNANIKENCLNNSLELLHLQKRFTNRFFLGLLYLLIVSFDIQL